MTTCVATPLRNKRVHEDPPDEPAAERQRVDSPTTVAAATTSEVTTQQPWCFRLLDLPDDEDGDYKKLRTRFIKRLRELLLTETNNYIHVQRVQLASLRFTKSKTRTFQNLDILYLNREARREGLKIALASNTFQFASLGIAADFLGKIAEDDRTVLTSITLPLWREDDLTEGHMLTIAKLLRDCKTLKSIKIMSRCSRIGCPVATQNSDAAEYAGDRLIYELHLIRKLRKLDPLPHIEMQIGECILMTHGKAGGPEQHTHHDMLMKEADDWLSQPLEGGPNIAEVLGRPVPKVRPTPSRAGTPRVTGCRRRGDQPRGRGARSSRGVARNAYETDAFINPFDVQVIASSDSASGSEAEAREMMRPARERGRQVHDDEREWRPDED